MPTEHQAPTDVVESVSCPQCMTRFRLKSQQLHAAGGLVRCGVCMSIFNAATGNTPKAHLSAAEPQQTALEPAETSHTESDTTADSPLDLIAGLSTLNHDFEHHRPRHQPRRWPWLMANFIALLALAGQIALWQKDAVFASPAGDYLQQLCPLHPLLCENKAPEARQLGDVVSTHLLVRKHPSVANALIVDTILLNRSAEPSPFPALKLHFSDINGQTLASRVFQPREYLAGELNALSDLASQQPVHIALEIVDPGSTAVNYQLQLLP
ncbi:putative Zn finger-like uncharacterized protein [Zhongshania antarctica]|uniref:Putative Zn finger-like uncharacterized protein n=1 Tax=Zhongshania antarctica TaxID=641702 RepID=A0A840R892_9GAMM|nr:zinc-ribbon and DUF3426 domain-containing protein [Zhongshania antarctica]MBB5188686.1 putative Zn finger-like uncharacterized protein [Zhongshania antarctica]